MAVTVEGSVLGLESDSGETFAVDNPATGETIAQVPRMGAAETRRAIERAEAALPKWRSMLAKDRGRILRRWSDLMLENEEGLARLLTTEQGKPLAESRIEIGYAASFYEWFGEEGKRVYGDTIPTYAADRRIVVTKDPIGVTAGITPWNFPAAMPTRKSAPALAAGCTMVLKPAEQTPLSALAIAQLGLEAGLPEGVFQIVTGAAEDAPVIGGELTSNPIVRKLGFTGSTEVGKLLMAQCAKQVKKVSLELGGNAPFIVFDDADLEEAILGAMICKFRNSGQTCISANRIFVQDGIYDAFLARLVEEVSKLKVGSGLDPETRVGPLIEQSAIDKVERHIGDAVARGGEVILGGEGLGGLFWQPTVLTGVTAEAAMSNEETFGPVAGIARFSTEEQAVRS
ncbi:MAG TPA: NAD-dependent succinate-semialdehyde dehydrogenase, partial [Gaiellaceae bacterium]|nr:NAD-dependent succinate-semialdehyde dehydrogenase [Gaiellaceae bacterium]